MSDEQRLRRCENCPALQEESAGSWEVYICTKFGMAPAVDVIDGEIVAVERVVGCFEGDQVGDSSQRSE